MTDPIVYALPTRIQRRKAADVLPFLEAYIAKKEQEIAEIEQMVERYEKRRLMEERAYQSMSAFRRLLAGKKPDHHLAVEYIHYVKKPMEKVRMLRQEIESARAIQQSSPTDLVTLSGELADEMN
ncbi:transcriptional regulator of heat shock response [Paenibacillus phyllosphaerae]|uniref:Transcriptional regulator of heat shock response n=1 Tax=Paenibacillus phyllosphaerae TaxID=274593 RepID=A0A7W5FKS7_9BACL|nr:hypothetical protein [Paenibacillus phyllosphaerae]MBB3108373.1 transcriptional regulator of heat shock response [Paenibacillus phyllosphaerae]